MRFFSKEIDHVGYQQTRISRRPRRFRRDACGVAAAAAPDKLDLAALKKDTDIACLYHCDFGDPNRFGQMLTNMNNHLSVYEFDDMRVKLVIVTHGAGVQVLHRRPDGTPWANDKIDPDLYKRFTGLSKFGVEAYLCEITFKRNNIDLGKAKKDRS